MLYCIVGIFFVCFLMFFSCVMCWNPNQFFALILRVFSGFIVLPPFQVSQGFQRVFNHSDPPLSSTSKYNLSYNFQDHF